MAAPESLQIVTNTMGLDNQVGTPEVEKVVDSANLVRRKYSEKPGLAENI